MQDYHAHDPHDTVIGHAKEPTSIGVLGLAVGLTLSFAAVEFSAGLISGSLALVADAGHMVTDSLALFLALAAQWFAKHPPTAASSYGHGRLEALAAFVNSLFMLGVVAWIAYLAINRFENPRPIAGGVVMIVAFIGLCMNLVVAWVLSRDKKNLNTRAALVHVMGDLLGSLAAIVSGAVIAFTGWVPIDPLLSLFVCALILKSTFTLLKMSFHILMEHVPAGIDFNQVGADLSAIDGISRVHNLHIWELTPGQVALTGHLKVADMGIWPDKLKEILALLHQKHGIDHVTLQPERDDD